MDLKAYKAKRKADTMRMCMAAWNDSPMDEQTIKRFCDRIRTRLRERALEFTEEEIREFVTTYGSSENPAYADNICVFCNLESSSVEKHVMAAFPGGVNVCGKCFHIRASHGN